MTTLSAISKGIIALTAASSLLAGLPRYDCLCASARPSQAGTVVRQSPPAKPSCCCCGTCCSQGSADEASCCGSSEIQGESTNCCGPSDALEGETDSRISGYGCQMVWSPGELAVVSTMADMKVDLKGVVSNLFYICVPDVLQSDSPRSPFRWKQYQLPPPPDLIVTFQHYLI